MDLLRRLREGKVVSTGKNSDRGLGPRLRWRKAELRTE